MNLIKLLVVLIILGSLAMPLAANAVTTELIIFTASPMLGGNNCVSNFEMSASIDAYLDVTMSWIPAETGNGTFIVRKLDSYPTSPTDGNATTIYSGNGSSTTDSVLGSLISRGVYYHGYTILEDGNYSICFVSGSITAMPEVTDVTAIAGNLSAIADAITTAGNATATGITNISNNMGIMILFCIPAVLLAAYWWRGSLLLGLSGSIATWLVWAPLKPYGEIFPVLLLILLVATILKMLYDVITSGPKI